MIHIISHNPDVLEIKNDKISVWVSSYGCTILKILVKDKNNEVQNVVLSMNDVNDYALKDGSYMGALVGRVANRIRDGHFVLNGRDYFLAKNNGPNCLHGGTDGFSYRMFDYEILEDGVRFHYVSKDGEENFPGTLTLYATYRLQQNSLVIEYEASSDADTIVNLTNHSYFNLNGKACSISDHKLQVHANQFGCVDENGLFTHVMRDVKGSPFDLNESKKIGDVLSQEDEQLVLAHGLDHSFLFSQSENQVVLYSEVSGIELCVSTSMPAAQIYSANFLSNGFHARDGICIETQYMPDSIDDFILKKDEVYKEHTVYAFGVR